MRHWGNPQVVESANPRSRNTLHGARRYSRNNERTVMSLLGVLVLTAVLTQTPAAALTQTPAAVSSECDEPARQSDTLTIAVCLDRWGSVTPRRIRLSRGERLQILVPDAIPMIYDLELGSRAFPDDDATRDLFRKLIGANGGVIVTDEMVGQLVQGASIVGMTRDTTRSPKAEFEALARRVLYYGGVIAVELRKVDDYDHTPGNAASVRSELLRAANRLGLSIYLGSENDLRTHVETSYAAIPTPDAATQALRSIVANAIPSIIFFHKKLSVFAYQRRTMPFEYTGGHVSVLLTLSNRLGDDYQAAVSAGGPIIVAVIEEAPSPFSFSAGIGGVLGSLRVTHRLERVSAVATPDTFRVVADSTRQLSFLPSVFFTFFPSQRLNPTLGLTIGAGLVGGKFTGLSENMDLVAGITIGRDWFRATVGGAYLSEITSLTGLGSDGTTTDPNILARQERSRHWRLLFALHATLGGDPAPKP